MSSLDLSFNIRVFDIAKKGKHGAYVKLNKNTGLKIIGKNGFKTIGGLLGSKDWQDTNKEYDFYNKLKDSSFTPNKVELVIVHIEQRIYPGIIMEHLSGKTFGEKYKSNRRYNIVNGKTSLANTKKYNDDYEKQDNLDEARYQLQKYFNKKLIQNYRLKHNDIHEENVIVSKKGELKLIDFSELYIQEVKTSEYESLIKKYN